MPDDSMSYLERLLEQLQRGFNSDITDLKSQINTLVNRELYDAKHEALQYQVNQLKSELDTERKKREEEKISSQQQIDNNRRNMKLAIFVAVLSVATGIIVQVISQLLQGGT